MKFDNKRNREIESGCWEGAGSGVRGELFLNRQRKSEHIKYLWEDSHNQWEGRREGWWEEKGREREREKERERSMRPKG